jgi:hypothetical protein
MDSAIIIGYLLQICIGASLIFAVEYRKRLPENTNPKLWYNRNPKIWKVAILTVSIWGWVVVIWSVYQLIIYLV